MDGHVYNEETNACSCGEYREEGYNRASRDRNWQEHLSKARAQLILDTPTLEEQVAELRRQLESLREEFNDLNSAYHYEHLTRTEW